MDRVMDFKLNHDRMHILAMGIMLLDHLGMVLFPSITWLRCIGRLAFPMFCFMIVEGYHYTKNIKKYALRLFISAIIAEIPFDLMLWGTWISPYQNVMWTLLIGLLGIIIIEKIKKFKNIFIKIGLNVLVICIGYVLGQVLIVDYFGAGILQILIFYYFYDKTWYNKIGQLIGVTYINYVMLGGYQIIWNGIEIPEQAIAILALPIIWIYKSEKNIKSKWFKYVCYGFYPVHMLMIYFINKIITS